jgi:hypothetical protein
MSRQQEARDLDAVNNVASLSHSVSSQSIHAANTELTTESESAYTDILDSDVTEHSATGNTTSGSDVVHNGNSSGDTVLVPTVEDSFLR